MATMTTKLAGAGLRFKEGPTPGALYGVVPGKPTVFRSALEMRPHFNGRKTQEAGFFDENVAAFLPLLLPTPSVGAAAGGTGAAGGAGGVVYDDSHFTLHLQDAPVEKATVVVHVDGVPGAQVMDLADALEGQHMLADGIRQAGLWQDWIPRTATAQAAADGDDPLIGLSRVLAGLPPGFSADAAALLLAPQQGSEWTPELVKGLITMVVAAVGKEDKAEHLSILLRSTALDMEGKQEEARMCMAAILGAADAQVMARVTTYLAKLGGLAPAPQPRLAGRKLGEVLGQRAAIVPAPVVEPQPTIIHPGVVTVLAAVAGPGVPMAIDSGAGALGPSAREQELAAELATLKRQLEVMEERRSAGERAAAQRPRTSSGASMAGGGGMRSGSPNVRTVSPLVPNAGTSSPLARGTPLLGTRSASPAQPPGLSAARASPSAGFASPGVTWGGGARGGLSHSPAPEPPTPSEGEGGLGGHARAASPGEGARGGHAGSREGEGGLGGHARAASPGEGARGGHAGSELGRELLEAVLGIEYETPEGDFLISVPLEHDDLAERLGRLAMRPEATTYRDPAIQAEADMEVVSENLDFLCLKLGVKASGRFFWTTLCESLCEVPSVSLADVSSRMALLESASETLQWRLKQAGPEPPPPPGTGGGRAKGPLRTLRISRNS